MWNLSIKLETAMAKRHPQKTPTQSDYEKEDLDLTSCEPEDTSSTEAEKECDRVYLIPNYPTIYFTRREMDCARELLTGKTVKEIAQSIGISHRSVELYLKNMRMKLNVNTKEELFLLIRDETEIEV